MNPGQKKRLIWAGGGAWALVALLILGTYWKPFARSEARRGSDEDYAADGHHIGHMIPDISDAEKQEFLQKARLVRDKWRPWARAHQADLQRMLDAGAEDLTTRYQISQMLPGSPTEIIKAGIRPEDVGFHRAGTNETDIWKQVELHWSPINNALQMPSSPVQSTRIANLEQKFIRNQSARERDDWKLIRDIPLAGGRAGRTETILWASGRITQRVGLSPREEELATKKVRDTGRALQESDFYHPIQEVEPSFDFLTPQVTF